MLPLAAFLMMGVVAWAITGDNLETDEVIEEEDLMPDPDPDPDPEPPMEDGVTFVTSSSTVIGTDDDDRFELSPDATTGVTNLTLDAGDGDDVIDLLEPADDPDTGDQEFNLFESEISGGAGDDVIELGANFSTVSGGEGNDTINVFNAGGAIILGGEGDDTIGGTLFAQDSATIDGGAGNDLIDARDFQNVGITGGLGDDTILLSFSNEPGAGFAISSNGGEGDDTIIYDGMAVFESDFEAAQTTNGGSGADSFEIRFNEGIAVLTDDADGLDPVELEVITIADFEPGTDMLQVEPFAANDGFTVGEARLEEDAAEGITRLIIRFDSDTQPVRDAVIEIGALGLDWDDVTFAGDEVPDLIPLA